MTSKLWIQIYHPGAKAVRLTIANGKKKKRVKWVIKAPGVRGYMATGNTESNAWTNARKALFTKKTK